MELERFRTEQIAAAIYNIFITVLNEIILIFLKQARINLDKTFQQYDYFFRHKLFPKDRFLKQQKK